MIKISQAIVVEGRYDKNTLSQIVDAPIFETSGFHIMKDKATQALLRRVAMERGLIVFTDSDGGGFVIRNFLKQIIPPQYLFHAYIPDIYGKEKRKSAPGKEGKLGLEGMSREVILTALENCGANFHPNEKQPITKQHLFALGLSGQANSSILRKQLLKKLELPEHMSANAMLQALDVLYSPEELADILKELPGYGEKV
jgi:ribonuclease M5